MRSNVNVIITAQKYNLWQHAETIRPWIFVANFYATPIARLIFTFVYVSHFIRPFRLFSKNSTNLYQSKSQDAN